MEICENCIDPDNPKYTGAKDHNDGWYISTADSTGSGNGAIHKR